MDVEMSAAVAAWVAALFGGAGFLLGVLGYVRSGRANDTAGRSNKIAEGANALAKESNQISQASADVVTAADARTVEQHDVRWEGSWAAAGVYRLTNIGTHSANGVVAQVQTSGERASANAGVVGARGHVDVSLADIRSTHLAEELAYAGSVGSGMRIVPIQPEIEERVFWRTSLGAPREHSHRRVVWFDPAEVRRLQV